MGRVLAKLASIKLGARTAAADRPTEVAIAYSAQALFDELPKETRRALGDVPAMLDRLEHHARDLRVRIELLDQSIAEAQNARAPSARDRQDALVADLRETRQQAESRLTDVMTALESTRLDLLRLRAGHGSVESVTQNVAAAHSLGVHVNRLLSGFAEVKAVLREGREATPV
jgi:chromosome segregation ATPase